MTLPRYMIFPGSNLYGGLLNEITFAGEGLTSATGASLLFRDLFGKLTALDFSSFFLSLNPFFLPRLPFFFGLSAVSSTGPYFLGISFGASGIIILSSLTVSSSAFSL